MTHPKVDEFDDYPQAYKNQEGGRNDGYASSSPFNISEGDRDLPPLPDATAQYHPGYKGQALVHSGGDISSSSEERLTQVRRRERSSHLSPSRGAEDKIAYDIIREDTVANLDGKRSPPMSSPSIAKDGKSVDKDDAASDELEVADGKAGVEKDEMNDQFATNDIDRDGNMQYSTKKQKIISSLEQPMLKELDNGENSKAARSSENSKARSGSSRDHHKWQHDLEEEVQDGRSTRARSMKRNLEEKESSYRRKDHDARHESEEEWTVVKGMEDAYSRREIDSTLAYHLHWGYDWRKDHENTDVAWQWRNGDTISRKNRNEDMRTKEYGDDARSRHKYKVRVGERSDQDDFLHSRKRLENGSYRAPYDDKGAFSRHRERGDILKSRYEIADDYYSKRRKDEEYLRRDHIEKEEILHGHRATTGHRRRERGDDSRLRDEQQRIKDNLDDYHSFRQKEVWVQRERSERQRGKEELYRLKQSNEECMSKREREEGRGSARSAHVPDEQAWIGHVKVKDDYNCSDKEYRLKDAARGSVHQKKKTRIEEESSTHHSGRVDHARGRQVGNEGKKSRQDRSSMNIDGVPDASDNRRSHEKKQKQSLKKDKEFGGGDDASFGHSGRNKERHSGQDDEKVLNDNNELGNSVTEIALPVGSSNGSKKEASSDDEQQDFRRGRSKLERWTSREERDYTVNTKSSSSLKFKESNKNTIFASSEGSKLPIEPPKKPEDAEKHSLVEEKLVVENETRPLEDWHLDTVEKLKKRSECFKLPMPSEKDALLIKKMESETLPSVRIENPLDAEVKPERPARKRRWISD